MSGHTKHRLASQSSVSSQTSAGRISHVSGISTSVSQSSIESYVSNPGDGKAVLVCIDGSKQAEHAFNFYLQNVYIPGDYVILGYVTEDILRSRYGMMSMPPTHIGNVHDMLSRQIKWLKDRYGGELKAKGIPYRFTKEAGVHSPGRHIMDMIKKWKVQLVVMGTRGLGTVKRTVLGSVSDYVLHHTRVPICICRLYGDAHQKPPNLGMTASTDNLVFAKGSPSLHKKVLMTGNRKRLDSL